MRAHRVEARFDPRRILKANWQAHDTAGFWVEARFDPRRILKDVGVNRQKSVYLG